MRQRTDQAADLRVGVVEEAGECFLEASRELLVILGHVVPRVDAGIAGCELRVGGQEAALDLVGMPLGAGEVPPLVERAAVLREVLRRRLVWRVRGAEREVEEERTVGPDGLRVVHELDRVIDEVLAQVVPVGRGFRRVHVVVVVHDLGMELIGLAVEEAVEPIEAALARPLVVRTRGGCVLHLTEVPLTDGEGGVALVP